MFPHPCLLCPWSGGGSLEDEEKATPQCEKGKDANPDRLVIKKPSEKSKTQHRKVVVVWGRGGGYRA